MTICMAFVISRSRTIFAYSTALITSLIIVKVKAKKFNNKNDTFISLGFFLSIITRIVLFTKEDGLCIFV